MRPVRQEASHASPKSANNGLKASVIYSNVSLKNATILCSPKKFDIFHQILVFPSR
jgi:hypothetical protein